MVAYLILLYVVAVVVAIIIFLVIILVVVVIVVTVVIVAVVVVVIIPAQVRHNLPWAALTQDEGPMLERLDFLFLCINDSAAIFVKVEQELIDFDECSLCR